jgi:light-regulated signal transduction histidine kinase (bacteriophytochrome)/CheY-like chemotaxis protein
MPSPPQTPAGEEPRSPGTVTSPSGQSAFIYPIRSAVSVKPVTGRTPSSDAFAANARRNQATEDARKHHHDQQQQQRSSDSVTRDRFELRDPPPSRVGGGATLQELDHEDEGSTPAVDGYQDSDNDDDGGGGGGVTSHDYAKEESAPSANPHSADEMRKLRQGGISDMTTSARKQAGSMHERQHSFQDTSISQAEKDRLESMTLPRFKHIATEHGHMVVTGREGDIARCEDEPIHIPGAVQSFGCMIVVREDEHGNLVVRQVSENTGDILGWSPSYLFKLDSLLDCFEEDQADILWDNLELLDDNTESLKESGPHVFQISGRGLQRPGRPERSWKAWIAAHRVVPKKKVDPDSGEEDQTPSPSLTVLEFELLGDAVNPISAKSPPSSPGEETDKGGDSSSASLRSSSGTSPPPSITTVDSDGTTKVSAAITTMTRVKGGLEGMPYVPTPEQFMESTQPSSKPLKALQRLNKEGTRGRARPRRQAQAGRETQNEPFRTLAERVDMLDMFGILSQINEQFAEQTELQSFLKVVVSVVRELTGFSRVMVYQFDERWNGQVVCELVDWNDTHDLYRGLHFPATDIPKQARDLYMINKIRLLYDRDQPSARMVCREKSDLETPIDMTHSQLRAMSPIHIKYLANMGVRASMSISITAFDQLWGLIALHTYGSRGRRISFPMRQLCRLIGESVSRNIERLSYTRRLSARKLINTLPTDQNPSGYIISNAEDLLMLFDADFGVIAIGNEAKILGPLSASQEVLAVTEYLRIKKFQQVITSQDVARDFPDMVLPSGLEVIAGLMLIPLSGSGIDFITFLRKAQTRHVNWAGKPFKEGNEAKAVLEPRKSFKIWSETVIGTCRAWKDEELETASVLCLVYGKFISVWRQREQAMQYNQLNKLLLSNATHEVRTPLNHIINYLEMALDSPLDADTRENLSKSHMASKSLLFVINDLLDLTRHEEGNKLFLQEPFDLSATVRDAVEMHEFEAKRRKIEFSLEVSPSKCFVIGDASRVRQIVVNTVSNSVKYTERGQIHVEMRTRIPQEMSTELPDGCDTEVELSISDSGCGISRERLEAIFREFEQVESVIADPSARRDDASITNDEEWATARRQQQVEDGQGKDSGIGLGLAIVARVVKNLGGQLRVDSTVGEGSRFTYYLPFKSSSAAEAAEATDSEGKMKRANSFGSGSNTSSVKSEINSLVEAISASHLDDNKMQRRSFDGHARENNAPRNVSAGGPVMNQRSASNDGSRPVVDSAVRLRSVKVDPHDLDTADRSTTERAASRHATPRKDSRQVEESMSSKFASGTAGDREQPPERVTLPAQASTKSELNTPASDQSPGATSGGSGSSGGNTLSPRNPGSSAAERRRAHAKLLKPSLASAAPSSKEKLQPLRVLVVEDDPVNRMILKKRLSMDGHTIELAVNGEDGVRKFEEKGHSIDIVLMDLQMPICNGQDACKRIRQHEKQQGRDHKIANRPAAHILNGRIPIFAVSATLDQSMRQEMCDIGMDGWLLKPIDFNRLRTLLKGLTHLEERQRERWAPGHVWEKGGWLSDPAHRPLEGASSPP